MSADANQLDWIERRGLGMARAQRRTERECGEDWTERAAQHLREFARRIAVGQPFLIEDARAAAPRSLGEPSNGKAWGPAVQRARKAGYIKGAGFAPARSSNGSPKCLWTAP